MKRAWAPTLLICVCACVAHAQGSPWLDPTITGVGKEPPRTQLRPYASQADAIARTGGNTAWVREINEWSAAQEGSDGSAFEGEFLMPFAWIDRQMLLRVPAAGGPYTVSVNGKPAGYSQQCHTPSEFDVTSLAREGANRVVVTLVGGSPSVAALENYREPAAARPPRGVCVVAQPRIRVREVLYTPSFSDGEGYLQLGVIVKSHLLNLKQVRVHYELISPEGKSILADGRDSRFQMRDEDTVTFFERVPDVRPWSAASPALYTLVVKLQSGGRYTEYMAAKIGFRTVGVSDGALTVNGAKVAMTMADFTPSGDIDTDRRRVEALRREGTNALRLLPHHAGEEFYTMCDDVGVYLVDMADVDTHKAGPARTRGANPSNDPAWAAAFVDRAVTAYHCSQLHPSVVMYSIGERSSNGFCLYESYLALKALDPGRPVIYPAAEGEWNSDMALDGLKGE